MKPIQHHWNSLVDLWSCSNPLEYELPWVQFKILSIVYLIPLWPDEQKLKQSHIAMTVFVKTHLMHGLLYKSTNLHIWGTGLTGSCICSSSYKVSQKWLATFWEYIIARWSGDVMKRPGHKNFNAVFHNRSQSEVLFLNLTWRSRGQISSVLLQLVVFAFSNRKFGRHGKWSVTFWQWENNT